ncbi:class I SAM-dependent methyltransferase [Alkalihalobacterium alkalinitrilicum]|uniref:class I SAM-dependent methyltransferase n=1 Tax=Alkalihalobacterium alkalinitrilicum TaxID=427920 RepID=UPI0009952884|nr:methyltransferase domain-containing protein [Alkalihalobacterium alkalinitrilicum]
MEEKDRVIRQFNETSDGYLTSNVHAKGKDLAWIGEIVQNVKRKKALDVATGAGHTALLLSQSVDYVVAMDITPNMLQLAESQAKEKGINNISFTLGDVENLPFVNETFDAVTCRIAAHHFPNLLKAVEEMHRVLSKDGVLIIVDNYIPEDNSNMINTIEKLRDPSHHECITLSKWKELFNKAKFTNIKCYQKWTSTMNLEEWVNRAKPTIENKTKINELIEKENLNWINKKEVHLEKVMWVCTK